jgi:hypothetical protein
VFRWVEKTVGLVVWGFVATVRIDAGAKVGSENGGALSFPMSDAGRSYK